MTYKLQITDNDLKGTNQTTIFIDFMVVIIQSILFALLSFLFKLPEQFFIIFAVVLAMDILWVFSVSQYRTPEIFRLQRNWAINNFIGVGGLLIGLLISSRMDFDLAVGFTCCIIFLNTVADFYINRQIYFPITQSD
jgi:hypothetical protein